MSEGIKLGKNSVWHPEWDANNVWGDNGSVSLGHASTLEEAELLVIEYEQLKVVACSWCGKKMKISDVAFSHFAGRYCEPCSKDYKRKYSSRCLICGRPRYECYC